jgi:hypothetical protein
VKAAWLSAGGTLNEGLSLALLGGLSRNRGYEEAITDSVERLLPGARITAVSGNHLDGAIAIAMTMKEDVPPLLRWWHKS